MTQALRKALEQAEASYELRGVLRESDEICRDVLASLARQITETRARLAEAREQNEAAQCVFATELAMHGRRP